MQHFSLVSYVEEVVLVGPIGAARFFLFLLLGLLLHLLLLRLFLLRRLFHELKLLICCIVRVFPATVSLILLRLDSKVLKI